MRLVNHLCGIAAHSSISAVPSSCKLSAYTGQAETAAGPTPKHVQLGWGLSSVLASPCGQWSQPANKYCCTTLAQCGGLALLSIRMKSGPDAGFYLCTSHRMRQPLCITYKSVRHLELMPAHTCTPSLTQLYTDHVPQLWHHSTLIWAPKNIGWLVDTVTTLTQWSSLVITSCYITDSLPNWL